MGFIPVEIWSDGSCNPNPGDAGVGIVLKSNGQMKEISEFLGTSTNNKAEVRAAIVGVLALKCPEQCDVTLYTDSDLIARVFNGDWRARDTKPLMEQLKEVSSRCGSFRVVKVDRNAGHRFNVLADRLARNAIRRENERIARRNQFSPLSTSEHQPQAALAEAG